MNELEKLLRGVVDTIKEAVDSASKPMKPVKKTETDVGVNKKQIEVELPEPPSSDNDDAMGEWEKLCNAKILEAIPRGYSLKSSEVKEVIIVRHYANIVVEKS